MWSLQRSIGGGATPRHLCSRLFADVVRVVCFAPLNMRKVMFLRWVGVLVMNILFFRHWAACTNRLN